MEGWLIGASVALERGKKPMHVGSIPTPSAISMTIQPALLGTQKRHSAQSLQPIHSRTRGD